MNLQSRASKMLLLARKDIQVKANIESEVKTDSVLTFCNNFGQDQDFSTLFTDNSSLVSTSASTDYLLADDNLITDGDLLTLAEQEVANLNYMCLNNQGEINVDPEIQQSFVHELIPGEEAQNSILEDIEACCRSDKSYQLSENETISSEDGVLEESQNNILMENFPRTRKKRRHVDQKQWKKNKNKILRQ
ncbi:unnamed protein product [Acanthoscelides obtectus]|uniref:Uncharacterized protein n=1 Tax=Acanthoscelides obtectus TaxID=200917 RepID=A0A9P0K015_ACAOB|nr:unnamed protein product [Acanthoscelides obtectus]CAK1660324.1 hypothetical protein AOBTE_LOCUS21992 [Acanthoscelides obtectus]